MEACGWTSSESRIGNYELGYNEPKLEDIEKMSQALGVNLVAAKPLPLFETKTDLDPREDGELDAEVLEIELGASAVGTVAPSFLETRYRHTFSAEWLARLGIKRSEKLYRCKVRGDSMEPVLYHGDMVLIRPSDKRVVDDATFAIVVADQLKVKKLRRRRDGGIDIVSSNARYGIESVPPEELDTLHIIGRVIDKSGSGGLG